MSEEVPAIAADAVLMQSEPLTSPVIQGFDHNTGVDYKALLDSYVTTGFQAGHFGQALLEVERMLSWSLADEPVAPDEEPEFQDEAARKQVRTKIWLSFTSNMVSCGVRESLRFLAQHSMVQVMITTCGAIEEDLIKCMADFHVGDFSLDGSSLRRKGINRTGNLLVPNDNYCKFEDWVKPILDEMHNEQEKNYVVWSPSKMIHRLGKHINDERSICYWAYKNDIPIFCPALTDGSIGDMLYFHSYNRPGFILDIAQDIRAVNDQAVKARKTGVIVLGGGVVKHHCMNANLMRNGADFAVFINTGQEFDGSDSGARPDEAKSWGKVRIDSQPVKVYADASLVMPLLVARVFATRLHEGRWDPSGRIFNKSYTASEADKERNKLLQQ